jgi:rhodanese-related sulfurtransferase
MRYLSYILAAVAVVLVIAYSFFWLPEHQKNEELPFDQLILELQNEKRFISTDQLAERMISQDPSLVLVDVRDAEAYDNYSLPGAVNIPLGEILDPSYASYFQEGDLDVVFFGQDNFLSEQAWMIKKRQNHHRVFILNGGLDQWEQDIMSPEAPPETAPSEDFDRYAFRKAAFQYFSGESTAFDPSTKAVNAQDGPKKTIKLLPKKARKKLEGC